jgi:regulator of protease activity HflC (stomatin/prohibitin superfamily)
MVWFFVAIGVLLLVVAYCGLQVLLAKSYAIRQGRKQVNLFGGLVKLILWEANEGIVLLKNKRVSDVIYGPQHGGGTQFIFPLFGEELRVRVLLTLKLTQFQDSNVLTRESTRLFLKVAFWWWIDDLEKYYYMIDEEVSIASDDPVRRATVNASEGPKDAAEKWILTLAESCIRKLVSQSTTALVVSKNASHYIHIDRAGVDGAPRRAKGLALPAQSQPQSAAHDEHVATPENLADAILQMLNPKVAEYGLRINRVEIQEVRLPQELQEALDRLFRSHLLPAQSEQEAMARQIELQSVANVLGVETLALKEVMKEFKGSTYVGGFPKFIEALFAKSQSSVKNRQGLGSSASRLALPVETEDDQPLLEQISHKCPKCGESVSVAIDRQGPEKRFNAPVAGQSFAPVCKRALVWIEASRFALRERCQ